MLKKKMHYHVTFPFDGKTASPAGRDLQQHELPKACREGRCECTIHVNHWVLVLGSLGQILDSLKGWQLDSPLPCVLSERKTSKPEQAFSLWRTDKLLVMPAGTLLRNGSPVEVEIGFVPWQGQRDLLYQEAAPPVQQVSRRVRWPSLPDWL